MQRENTGAEQPWHPHFTHLHTLETPGWDHMKGHFGMLTQALLSPPSLVSPPALTFVIRLRRHTLVLPRRPQRSRPGAVSGAAAVCATPNTHMTTPGGIFCWPRWKGDTTSSLLSLLSAVDGDVTSQLPASATTPATCGHPVMDSHPSGTRSPNPLFSQLPWPCVPSSNRKVTSADPKHSFLPTRQTEQLCQQ